MLKAKCAYTGRTLAETSNAKGARSRTAQVELRSTPSESKQAGMAKTARTGLLAPTVSAACSGAPRSGGRLRREARPYCDGGRAAKVRKSLLVVVDFGLG